MSESTLRVGFVGAGVIAWAHALAIRAMVKHGDIDVRIVSVHDRDPERAAAFASSNRADAAPSAGEVARSSDVVFVCTSTDAHLGAVQASVEAGRPIFCEKPLGRNLEEAERLVAVVRAAGTPSQVGLVLRTSPVFRALQELVASGALGRPMAVVFRDDQYFPIQGHYGSTWRADVSIAGAGALLEHSIHDVDVLRMCFGEVATLSAICRNFAGHEGIEDVAAGTLQMASGAAASLVSVWHNVLSRPSTRRMEVVLEDGVVWLEDDFTGPLTIQTGETTEVRPCPPPDWVSSLPLPDSAVGLSVRAYAEEDRAFVDSVVAGSVPAPGLDEALAAHRVVDAWYRSAAAGGALVVGPW